MASWRQGLLSDLGYPKRAECFTRLPQFGSIFGALALLGPMMLAPPFQRLPRAGYPRPSRCAIAAASVRLRVPSLARMFETCTLAVLAAMNS
jgi:hypothetical protein